MIARAFMVLGVLLATGASGASSAADPPVRAYVQPSGQVSDLQTVRLVVEAEGPDVPELSVPHLPSLKNLKLVGGPSVQQSTNISFDGTRSRQVTVRRLVYTLVPEGPGAAEIPPIEVHAGDRTMQTEAIHLEVVKEANAGRARPAPGGPSSSDSAPVFVEARLAEDTVWVGEPVQLEVTCYAATDVGGLDWVDGPNFANFWVEDANPDPQAEAYRTTVAGRLYSAYPVVRKVLVPTTDGEFTLSPYSARIQVSRPTGDPFQDLFSIGRAQTVVRRTKPLQLKVQPLPEAGRPADFSGAVGSFRMDTTVDRESARVNDAVSLKVVVTGEGFLRSVPPPTLESGPDLKVFEPKISESSDVRGGRLVARKTWEWVVVPLRAGEMPLPDIRFSFFDSATGRYRELRGTQRTLAVERAEEGSNESVARGEVRQERREIAFIKALRSPLREGRARIHQQAWYLGLLTAPFLLSPVVILVARRRARLLRDRGLARGRRARRRARKRLRSAERRMMQMESGAFHEEVARALVEYLADRFDRSPSGLTYEVADDLLASKGVDGELRRRVRTCLESCDFARYVAGAGQSERRAEVQREAQDVIARLEKALP